MLLHATLKDLCNHFQKELLEDPDWAVTPAGMDYNYFQKDYILREEILHFACTAYNMIHPDRRIEIPARYQQPQYDSPSTTDTPEPMADKPPVPPQRATMPYYLRWEPGYTPAHQATHIPTGTDRQARKGRLGSLLPQQEAMVRDRRMYLRYPFNRLTSRNHQVAHHQVDHHHPDRTGGRHPDTRRHPDRQIRRLRGFLTQPT